MRRIPFFLPMFAGFAITAAAMLAAASRADAQTTPETQCEAPAAKPHGLRLGRLLSAVHNSRAGQMLAGAGQRGIIVATIANTALEAASQTQSDTTNPAPACTPAQH